MKTFKQFLLEYDEILKVGDVTTAIEVTDSHDGQIDGYIGAYINKKAVGALEFAFYNGVPSISMIRVVPEHQRKGIGSLLVKSLAKEFDVSVDKVKWGMMTPDGAKLKSSMGL